MNFRQIKIGECGRFCYKRARFITRSEGMFELRTERRGAEEWLVMGGELCLEAVEQKTQEALHAVEKASGNICIDMRGVTGIDTTGCALISAMRREGEQRGLKLVVSGASAQVSRTLDNFLWLTGGGRPRRTWGDWIAERGEWLLGLREEVLVFLQMMADTVIWSLGGEKRTQRVRRGAVIEEAVRIGLDALGIIVLLTFLVGAVVALQTASLLKLFGADILVADMIGISMVRELSPLLTAILVAGRSGASIAAEIATMNINEEVAGIRTMGLEPVKYIVVPKFRAITLTIPGLTVFSICAGIFGGFLIAVLYMGLSPTAFFYELVGVMFVKDILVTLLKSVVFAWIIVWVAAYEGFSAYGGSEAVGRVTTASVVKSIFSCIIADAVFSVIFYFGG